MFIAVMTSSHMTHIKQQKSLFLHLDIIYALLFSRPNLVYKSCFSTAMWPKMIFTLAATAILNLHPVVIPIRVILQKSSDLVQVGQYSTTSFFQHGFYPPFWIFNEMKFYHSTFLGLNFFSVM